MHRKETYAIVANRLDASGCSEGKYRQSTNLVANQSLGVESGKNEYLLLQN
jgi:hypothetical protein